MTAVMPSRDEIGPNDVLVQTLTKPDSRGRVRFAAFWLDDDHAVKPGVRGQVFYTSLAKFTDRAEKAGEKVRHWTPEGGVE